MFILDSLLIGSLRFVLDKVIAAAEAELQDDTALRDQLLEAQMRLELGNFPAHRCKRHSELARGRRKAPCLDRRQQRRHRFKPVHVISIIWKDIS